MKSKQLSIHNMPDVKQAESEISAKPYLLMIFFVLVSAFIARKVNFWFGAGFGLFAIGLFALLPSRVLIRFFKEYMILFNKGREECMLIYYEDVEKYEYEEGKDADEVIFTLKDGSEERLEAFSRKLFEKRLNKYLK